MRKYRNPLTFNALLLISLAMSFLAACHAPGVQKAPPSSQLEDSAAIQEDKTPNKEDVSNENVIADTVYGDWHIRVEAVDSKLKVKDSEEFVKKLILTVSKGGKVLFDKKEFTREDILKGADEAFQVYAAPAPDFTNTSVYLPVALFYPETDDGFSFLLTCSKDGSSKLYPVPLALDESDMVTDFYVRYTHECQQKPVDKASLMKLARDYGSPAFVKQLTKEGTQAVYPAKVLSRKDMNIMIESELVKGGCLVKFFTAYDDTNAFDSIRVELKKRSTGKAYDYDETIDKVIHE